MQKVSFREALGVWIRVALYSFGGPAGQISVMHRLVVEEKKWISEKRFLHALNYCMLLPGPEAQQLATYLGWLLHKTKDGLTAGILFILPGFISILILSILYALYNDFTVVNALFYGIKPAVIAIVAGAIIKIGSKALKNNFTIALAVSSFIAIYFFNVAFPFIIIFSAFISYLTGLSVSKDFKLINDDTEHDNFETYTEKTSVKKTGFTVFVFLIIWFAPLILLLLMFGDEHIWVKEMFFFSKVAVLTFGGAYAVLAYVAQQAVEFYQWLLPGEMLDGLGMAETTPGPLIQVVQFVGFMGAYRHAVDIDPLLSAIIGSVLVTWVTFVPCFLFVFAGAPYMEKLRHNKTINIILTGITAAVVGVITNLALWFSIHTLFSIVAEKQLGILKFSSPVLNSFDAGAAAVMVLALFIYFVLKANMFITIFSSVIAGMIVYFLFHT